MPAGNVALAPVMVSASSVLVVIVPELNDALVLDVVAGDRGAVEVSVVVVGDVATVVVVWAVVSIRVVVFVDVVEVVVSVVDLLSPVVVVLVASPVPASARGCMLS